ncbi:MAG: nucleotidyltransferase family protein [Clostridia bacterium]|nr:nucleotidyltransferase family protein [Clostridia bacterium]
MKENEELFLQILKSYVNSRSFEKENGGEISGEAVGSVLALAKKHSVQAMCEYALSGHTQLVNQTVARSVKRIFAATTLLGIFEEKGIKLCVMKGFIVRGFYAIPELRTFGDIDFLIEKDSESTVISLMEELGYSREPGEEHVISFKKDLEYYEFHTRLAEDDAFEGSVEKLLSSAWSYTKNYNDYKYIYEFEDEFHLFYMIFHIAKHFRTSGAGVRMFCDIAVFLQKNKALDMIKFSSLLSSCNMALFAQNVLYICRQWFGTESPILDRGYQMSDNLLTEITEFVLNGGTFGFCGSSLEASEIRREMDRQNDSSRTAASAEKRTLFRFFFPTYEKMKKRYSFVEGKKFLMPIAYIMRFFGSIFKPKRAKKAVGRLQGIRSGGDEAMKQHAMYKECGLDFFK